MRALITGGAGFVGRHLSQRLLLIGWEVVVVDPLIQNSGGLKPEEWPLFDPTGFEHFHYIHMDCREYFRANSCEYFDYVFHLGAVVGGRIMIERDPLAVATDLSIDAEMWRWCVKSKPKKVINFSSSAAYPVQLQTSELEIIKLREEMISFDRDLGMPDLTYGWAKLTSEYLGKLAWQRYGIDNVAYRPFSGYGPDQNVSYPFPSICLRAINLRNQREFNVWGSGKQSRDFIHIDDCISGVLMTMDEIGQGNSLNLSTGIPTSFFDFAKIVTNLLGYSPNIVGDSTMPQGVTSRIGDIEKQQKYGFVTKRSFESGIADCLDFFLGMH